MGKKSKKSKKMSKKLKKYLKNYHKQQANGAAPAPPGGGAIPGIGGWVNDAVPDSSTLLAYKLLKDSVGADNAEIFQDMLTNELKYLMGGIALLKNDQKISQTMGGETMANAAQLAAILKGKTKELDVNDRIESVASDLLYHDYAKPGKRGLAPQRIDSSVLENMGNGNARLHWRVSGTGPATNGITLNTAAANIPGAPAIAARAGANAGRADFTGAPGRIFV